MNTSGDTHIICILPKLGASVGGGKINAVFTRMNLLADREATQVTLLNLQHGCNQAIAFAELVRAGIVDARIAHRSIYELCAPKGVEPPARPTLPNWDDAKTSNGTKDRTVYLRDGVPVMRDSVEHTPAGVMITRHLLDTPGRNLRLKYIDNRLIESREAFGDGLVDKVVFVDGHPRCRTRRESGALVEIEDYALGRVFKDDVAHQRMLALRHFPEDAIVFIDGITSAYLSRPIPARKVLFLHADHRSSSGKVVPRSRGLIEAFDGDAIITATRVHKERLEAEVAHKAPIRVIPHYTDVVEIPNTTRKDICTVSRLELTGKPIHQCIEAFVRVMHLIPGTNYLIYGSGQGAARLQQLIDHHECGDRVILMGHTANAADVFSRSLFSLAPTITEGFGLALLEALTCNCPVITYDVDYGPRELINPGENGELLQPGDIDAIAAAILKVHGDRERYAAGCAASVEQYSFDRYKDRYHRLIDDLVANRFYFDLSARDLKAEALRALEKAPAQHRDRLLDLYINQCHLSRDLGGMYDGFQQKIALHPKDQRPIVRCIWLSRRLGRLTECRAHLALFAQRFPGSHADFVARYPDFLELADAVDGLA
ncbi:MAG: glycosyltransferase [Marivita sp.]|uniref:glycosyltransferase n=1 Tax=Marivita sp. TaxID=2003365 RepID=UPI001B167A36|nr:glycosyltransferase [Marivita sp.]MBO6882156.1 glycosyltransferase [Marivita sp.]